MTDTQKQIDSMLSAWNIEFSVALMGATTREDKWECDEWHVKIGAMETRYYTRTGRRKPKKGAVRTTARKGTVAYANWERANLEPVAPCAADVLYSLLYDSAAIDMSFDDWCDIYGFYSASLKAFNTYQQCCASGKELRKVFSAEQRAGLSELLQDY